MWDVVQRAALYNLRGHEGRVFCVAWARFDSNVLFSGGDDQTVRRWDLRELLDTPSCPPSHAALKKKAKEAGKKQDVVGASGEAAAELAGAGCVEEPNSVANVEDAAPEGNGDDEVNGDDNDNENDDRANHLSGEDGRADISASVTVASEAAANKGSDIIDPPSEEPAVSSLSLSQHGITKQQSQKPTVQSAASVQGKKPRRSKRSVIISADHWDKFHNAPLPHARQSVIDLAQAVASGASRQATNEVLKTSIASQCQSLEDAGGITRIFPLE